MKKYEIFNAFDKFLKDENLSLRAKGFLTMILTENITSGYEIENYCTDSHEDVNDALLELRINHYVRYNPLTNVLEADAIPYEEWPKKDKDDDFEL